MPLTAVVLAWFRSLFAERRMIVAAALVLATLAVGWLFIPFALIVTVTADLLTKIGPMALPLLHGEVVACDRRT